MATPPAPGRRARRVIVIVIILKLLLRCKSKVPAVVAVAVPVLLLTALRGREGGELEAAPQWRRMRLARMQLVLRATC